jgi:hypothetical protein
MYRCAINSRPIFCLPFSRRDLNSSAEYLVLKKKPESAPVECESTLGSAYKTGSVKNSAMNDWKLSMTEIPFPPEESIGFTIKISGVCVLSPAIDLLNFSAASRATKNSRSCSMSSKKNVSGCILDAKRGEMRDNERSQCRDGLKFLLRDLARHGSCVMLQVFGKEILLCQFKFVRNMVPVLKLTDELLCGETRSIAEPDEFQKAQYLGLYQKTW